jgi:tRNA pseudouridine38-40 synthase
VTAAQRRWRLDLSYDGAGFHGFAAQPGTVTVAGELAGALATVLRLREPPTLTCAGRTDAGVHALGQVVHVELPDPLFDDERDDAAARLARACTKLLAPRIVVTACAPAPEGFDARHSATSRSYRYLVHESDVPSPLLEAMAWHRRGPLDERAMAQAAFALLGEHDFRAFCRRPSGTDAGEPILRRVTSIEVGTVADTMLVAGRGRLVRIEVTAASFCHQMVRSIVAALVAIGEHELTGADLVEHLHTGDRGGLPSPAPPGGLCLVSVGYLPAGADLS